MVKTQQLRNHEEKAGVMGEDHVVARNEAETPEDVHDGGTPVAEVSVLVRLDEEELVLDFHALVLDPLLVRTS